MKYSILFNSGEYAQLFSHFLFYRNTGAKFYIHAPDQFLDLSGRMGHKIFRGQKMTTEVKYTDFYQLERTLENNEKSCSYHNYDDCMYSVLYSLMINNTMENCTVPWIRDNHKICTKPDDINTAFWIGWNRVTNQRNDCGSPCNRLITNLGAKQIIKLKNDVDEDKAVLLLYFPQKMLIIKEHFLYKIFNLLGEIGGYVGLFLGYSLFHVATFFNKFIDFHIKKQASKK